MEMEMNEPRLSVQPHLQCTERTNLLRGPSGHVEQWAWRYNTKIQLLCQK